MLRAHPTRYTSALPELRRLLEDIGLVATEEGKSWVVLDAGSGRVRLRSVSAGSPGDGMTAFSVEIREPGTFVRRMVQDGGRAHVEDTITGPRVRVTGPDGFSFLAEPTSHAVTSTAADPNVTVHMEWLTPDVPGAAAALAAIGGRPRTDSPGQRDPAEFTAKNGGVLAARGHRVLGAGGLFLEDDGDLGALADRLASHGWSPQPEAGGSGAPGRADGVVRLRVPTSDGSEVTILTAPGAMR
ncbi:hypothetical protein GCM10027449_06250 [Sinomonas notoginsengisoli]|uniref:VOC family protein n=1 Tax=Sinomonas notoginsengisoli TaxID=1457311 RepID=UPI001F1F30EF|nr:VOC family protein [Sinomonas notoginsengisoli]